MAANCGQTVIPTTDETPLPCPEFYSDRCIIHEPAVSYLGLGENSPYDEFMNAYLLSLIDARNRLVIVENRAPFPGFTSLQIDYGVTLGSVATSNSYLDLDDLPTFASISDAVYDAGWNGDTINGASKNAIYDKIETLVTLGTTQTITATKTVNVGSGGANGINVTNSSSGMGIEITNSSSGRGIYVNGTNTSLGTGIFVRNTANFSTGIHSLSTAGTAISIGVSNAGDGLKINASDTSNAFTIISSSSSPAMGVTLTGSGKGLLINGQLGSTGANAIEVQDNTFTRFTVTKEGAVNASGQGSFANIRTTTGYTVAGLPAGTIGMRAYVTDATAPTYLGTLTGGGTVVCPVFYNGSAWVSA